MKRYVFYDPTTGEIVHTHHVVTEARDFVDVDDRDLAMMVDRFVDTSTTASLVSNIRTISSRGAVHRVDTKRNRVVTSRLRRSSSRSERRKEDG